ncbi:A24 family peptidase [soil metagenome]
MEITVIYIALVLIGLVFGSFAGATVWRLRARQLVQDKAHGDDSEKAEYTRLQKLTTTPLAKDRSQCLHCSYKLRWYDMIPLISWISLRGKCRHCHHSIGILEPIIELGVALFFVLSYMFWPYPLADAIDIGRLIIWLLAGTGLSILFAYDAKWFLLPDKISIAVIGLGLVSSMTAVIQSGDFVGSIASVAGAIIILSGIYFMLYVVSKGRWIGFGDIKLGLGLALLLADFRLAFIALFAANLVGTLLVIPAMISGKLKRNSHVPFGPLLIIGTIIAQFFGLYLLDLYVVNLL